MQVVFTKHGSSLPRDVHEKLLHNLVSGLKAKTFAHNLAHPHKSWNSPDHSSMTT